VRRSTTSFLIRSAVAASLALTTFATAQTRPSTADDLIPVGMESFDIPPAILRNDTPPRVAQLLAEALAANPHALRRVELVRDLGECRLPAAIVPVVKAAADPDAIVRAQAARSLALLGGGADVLAALRTLAADKEPAVRCEVVRAAAALNAAPLVTTALDDTDESVFAAACAVASTPEHAQRIAARMASATTARVKLVAVRALGRMSAIAHATGIVEQLATDDMSLTVTALDALAQMKATQQASTVRERLGHAHPTVRRAATAGMAALTEGAEQSAIGLRMLQDADPTVRAAAARLLAAHPTPEAATTLAAQLAGDHEPLRRAARDALVATAAVAQQPVAGAAAKLLDDEDPHRREDGSYVLGQLRSDAALARHLVLLGDSDWGVAAQAAESLGRIGSPEAAPGLMKLVAGTSAIKQTGSVDASQAKAIGNALIACGQLHYRPVVELTKPLISEKTVYPPSVRVPAIWAAGAASGPNDADVAARCLSVYRDTTPYEVEEARFEAAKAIGNMRYVAALEEMRRHSAQNPLPTLRWIAYRVAERLSGGPLPTPYTPPPMPTVADTSIKVLASPQ
jgi:HEAT repeat protein